MYDVLPKVETLKLFFASLK